MAMKMYIDVSYLFLDLERFQYFYHVVVLRCISLSIWRCLAINKVEDMLGKLNEKVMFIN